MIASIGVVFFLGVALVAWLALRGGRRALAGELVGEISEILDIIDAHGTERELAAFCDGESAAPMLPRLPSIVFQASAAWMPILGLRVARLSATFYASAGTLNEELQALSVIQQAGGRKAGGEVVLARLRHTVELGEECLRALRDVLAGRRHDVVARA